MQRVNVRKSPLILGFALLLGWLPAQARAAEGCCDAPDPAMLCCAGGGAMDLAAQSQEATGDAHAAPAPDETPLGARHSARSCRCASDAPPPDAPLPAQQRADVRQPLPRKTKSPFQIVSIDLICSGSSLRASASRLDAMRRSPPDVPIFLQLQIFRL